MVWFEKFEIMFGGKPKLGIWFHLYVLWKLSPWIYAWVTSLFHTSNLYIASRVIWRWIFRIRTTFDEWTRYYVSISLCTCKKNRSLYLSLSVFKFSMSIIIRPPTIFASSGMLQSGTNEKYFRASIPSFYCLMASCILCEVYVGFDFNTTSLRTVGYTYEVVLGDFIVSMSCLMSEFWV